jgi:hypothetical protein
MPGPEKDIELEAAAHAIEDAGRDDHDDNELQKEAAEAADDDQTRKGDTPGMKSVHEANAEGVNPD